MENRFYTDAKLKQKQRDFNAALNLYLKALEVEPYNPDLLSDTGVCLFNLDRKKEALDYLDRAANLEPNNSYRYSSRAFIKAALGDVQGGIEDYEKCIELDPEDAIAYNNLGMLQEQLGYKKQAENTFKKADELAEILKENNISFSKEETIISETFVDDIDTKPTSFFKELKAVFTSKKSFKEFIHFIKNGFKLKS
ncbi:MAG: tetratricopeptide repeat protein [Bacteroidia bacterium]